MFFNYIKLLKYPFSNVACCVCHLSKLTSGSTGKNSFGDENLAENYKYQMQKLYSMYKNNGGMKLL